MNNNQKTYTISQASQILGVTPQTLHSWRRKGWILSAELPNGRYLVEDAEIQRLIADGKKSIEPLPAPKELTTLPDGKPGRSF